MASQDLACSPGRRDESRSIVEKDDLGIDLLDQGLI
jgi:hypothetical protein